MMVKWFLLGCLALHGLLVTVRSAESYRDHEESLGNVPAVRRKRNLGSILVLGGSVVMRTTNLGLTLAQAVTDGCATRPSICVNRDIIEKLDAVIKVKKAKFDSIYASNGKSFVDLREASVNNARISYRTNESIRAIETIDEIAEGIIQKLTLKDFPEFAQLAAAINMSVTSEEYLESVVGQLEYTLESLRDQIVATKNNQLNSIAMQFLIEAFTYMFMKSFSSAYGQVAEDIFGGPPIESIFFDKRFKFQSSKPSFMLKAKLLPSVIGRMGLNTGKYLYDRRIPGNLLQKGSYIQSFTKLTDKFQNSISKPMQKFQTVREFVSNQVETRRKGIENFKLKTSVKIMASLGIISDVVGIAMNELQWKKVADEMEKAKNIYVEHNKTLTAKLAEIKAEGMEIEKGWKNTTEAFKEVSEAVIELFTDLANNTDFNDVVGLPELPVDFMSAYLPSNFQEIEKDNVLSKQQIILNFLNSMNSEFQQIQDEMSARLILYSNVIQSFNSSQPIATILDSLKSIYRNKDSKTIQEFGNHMTTKDLACTIAQRFPLKAEYDFLQLTTLRDKLCNVSDAAFSEMETAAQEQRNKQIMLATVTSEVTKNPSMSLSDLWSSVKNPYVFSLDPLIKNYGMSIAEKDIICAVATQFPAKDAFDYISLAEFRPSCSAVSASGFQTILDKANGIKTLASEVSSTMDVCDNFSLCPCISLIVAKSSALKVTKEDIVSLIKSVRPEKTKYCGNVAGPCDCVDL